MQKSERLTLIALIVLSFACVLVWISAWEGSRGELRVSFLDIGQGDAIFIQAPNGMQALIDGGSDTTVLRRLGEVMPWYDHSIDLLIGTHPDLDHIGGLIDVLPRYNVGTILVPSVEGTTDAWRIYLKEVHDEHAHVIDAKRGERIMLGDAYMDVLFPDRETPHVETNTGCIVVRLVYKSTSFMLSW
jgi:competence protein ComEC